jgi:PKD repeat protein
VRGTAGFEGIEAQVVSSSPAEVRVIAPAAAAPGQSLLNRQVDILLRNLSSGFSTTAAAAFKYVGQQLLVSSMDVREGPYTGGTTVTIRGQGFVPPVEVQFGGTSQEVVSVSLDGRTIQARSVRVQVKECKPPSGPLVVKNLNTGEMAATGFLFNYRADPPVVSSVAPSHGPQEGGQAVAIQGSGFEPATRVEFGGVVAVGPQVTPSQVQVTTPAFTGAFEADPCDDNGDGQQGMRSKPKAVDVKVTSIDSGCVAVFPQGYSYDPTDRSCRGDSAGPPVADFDFTVADLTVRFSDRSGGGPPSTWLWDFGEPVSGAANSSTVPNPQHTYAAAGTYAVRLTVSNSAGTNSVSKSVALTAPAPQASFTWTVASAPRTVQFTATSTGGPATSWAWSFGDPASGGSNSSTARNPVHTFSGPGTYTVTLVVSNTGGSTSQPQFVTVP